MTNQISFWLAIVTIFFLIVSITAFMFIFPKFLEESRLMRKISGSQTDNNTLTKYMSELSICGRKERVIELCDLIRSENKKFLETHITPIQKKQAQTVMIWLKKFSIDMHMGDINKKKTSSQISYDTKKKSYTLKIIK